MEAHDLFDDPEVLSSDDSDLDYDELEEALANGVSPTGCPEGCQVEPDGTCPHGYESVLLREGLI